VCDAKGKLWNVNRDGRSRLVAADERRLHPARERHRRRPDGAGGFVTDVHVTYQDASTYQRRRRSPLVASRPYGRFEQTLDITDKGPIATTQAQEHGDNWLASAARGCGSPARSPSRPGNCSTPAGHRSTWRPCRRSDGLVRVMLTDPDSAAGELDARTQQLSTAAVQAWTGFSTWQPTAGLHRLAITVRRSTGTGTLTAGDATRTSQLLVVDLGLTP
jgi:hypothetical protein